eukprot:403362251
MRILLGSALFLISTINTLSIALKDNNKYCFKIQIRKFQDLRVTYDISGRNQDKIMFQISNQNEVIHEESGKQESTVMSQAKKGDNLEICWKRLDDKTKMVNFQTKVMDYNSDEKASMKDLEIINHEMQDIESMLYRVSKNVNDQQEIDQKHSGQTISSAWKQTWISIVKLMIVMCVCAGQVYMVVQFFQQKKGSSSNSSYLGRNVI